MINACKGGLIMRKLCLLLAFLLLLVGCANTRAERTCPLVAATTRPVAEMTAAIVDGTDITVERVVGESVSCLHDYSLSVRQMELLQSADLVILSGAGLEDFMADALASAKAVVDASAGITLRQDGDELDPHIWLDPLRAKQMAQTIADALCAHYPQYQEQFTKNCAALTAELDAIHDYGTQTLAELPSRNLITFHDGFGYFAETFDLTVLAAMEEEAGSEIAAKDLAEIVALVRQYNVPAVFTEQNGADSAANAVAAETDCGIFVLDTGLGDTPYLDALRHNIDTVREALS